MHVGEVMFVTASDGVKLATHVEGSGPPLYALHGGPMNDHRTFGGYLDPSGEYRTLQLLDQRGCGDSGDAPPDTYTLARLAEDIQDTRGAGPRADRPSRAFPRRSDSSSLCSALARPRADVNHCWLSRSRPQWRPRLAESVTRLGHANRR